MNARPKREEDYVGKPPAYFLGVIFNRFLIVYAAIIVIVRMAGSNGFRIIPQPLEPAAIDFVSFIFPAFRVQYQQLATLANEGVQSQYLAVIFFTISAGFGVMFFSVAKFSKVWRQLAAPDALNYFMIAIMLPILIWPLTYEKFKESPAINSLTALFFDSSFGWFYIRQAGIVLSAQFFLAAAILSIAKLILMYVKLPKDVQ
jgi:hypothetical protein